ncbi:MAG: 1,4-alpha-glucan branching protein GlgB [Firmicutes bacterium]|nr:1,4-alpha-glucan branching protein GlgB [Bacillota bacterium]
MERFPDAKDIYLFNTGHARRAYLMLGCHRDGKRFRFTLWAPRARSVSLVGDFNGWDAAACPMSPGPTGLWQCCVSGVRAGDRYKYAVTGSDGRTTLKADPYAFYTERPPGSASRVWEGPDYVWQDGDYLARRASRELRREPMSVYELHLGSWRRPEGEEYPPYRVIGPELVSYCREMGYTHVELLPLTEYPYDGSWGYQVTGYFAPTARYGPPQDLMYLIDLLHQSGIGVILDWVPAHFPRDAHGLALFDGAPLYEVSDYRRALHPEWGTLIFDYSRPQVVSFLISSALYWLEVYHVDGLRVDAVSSMLYLNYGRSDRQFRNREGGEIDLDAVSFLQELNRAVAEEYPGCVTVAEEATAYPHVTGDPRDGGLGFVFKWDMGLMHDTLDYMATDPLYRCYHHDKLTFSMLYAFSEHFINAFSHDEVVHGKKSLLDKMFGSYEQKFANLRALFGLQYGHPGKKLNFMGSEFAQFIEWNEHQELDWFLLRYPAHDSVKAWVRELNRFYLSHPALWRVDDSWQGFTWLSVDDSSHGAIAFLRRSDRAGDKPVVCLYSFTPQPGRIRIGLPAWGRLDEVLSSDEFRFGGTGSSDGRPLLAEDEPWAGHPFSVCIELPPLAAVFYEFTEIEQPPAAQTKQASAPGASPPKPEAKPQQKQGPDSKPQPEPVLEPQLEPRPETDPEPEPEPDH